MKSTASSNCHFAPPEAPAHTEGTSVVVLATDPSVEIVIASVCILL